MNAAAGTAAAAGAPRLDLGILVIDLKTRERMRLNGHAEVTPEGTLIVHAREVYFNCPQYIQKRVIDQSVGSDETGTVGVTRGHALTSEQHVWISTADTFFVASAVPGGGADASHRGGNPGFVRVRDASSLEWPDYSGNTMFNTLGNITVNPNAGLLFLNFEQGNTLQLTGQAAVVWEPERAARFPGAQRIVGFHIEQAIQAAHAVPLHFRFLQYSRFNPSGTKDKKAPS
ncbi:MAG: pyridoxamine 5'-phosphate oxidase family protein [Akkermansiaceae bacterium]|nr:pyridoxamine 5'-phosphate oxidase family protein [Armatimonadota bacterium]